MEKVGPFIGIPLSGVALVVDVVVFEVPVSDESVGDGELSVDNVGESYEEKEEEGYFFHGTSVVAPSSQQRTQKSRKFGS